MWSLGLDDLGDLSLGARLLGAGGGGDILAARLVLHQALEDHGPVPIVDLDELPDDAQLATVAVVGTPSVLTEKIPGVDQLITVVEALVSKLGRPLDAVVPLVVGGMNTFFPLAAAAELGIPCVDGDGMRRTLPGVDMTTFTLAGVPASPLSVGDEKGNTVLLDIHDNKLAGEVARRSAMTFGMSSTCASYPMTAARARNATVRSSLSYCVKLGELLRQAQHGGSLEAMTEYAGGRILGEGRIVAVDRQATFGFPRGSLAVERLDDAAGTLRIEMQNELLLAIEDGEVVVTPPDLICVLDFDDLEPLTTDDLVAGQRIQVIALPSAQEWWRPGVLELVGPAAFGYNVHPRPFGMRR